MNSSTQRQPMHVFLDEFSYYLGRHDERLKEELREIEGVPNATYLVKGRQVFVFDKLVQLVKEHRKNHPELSLAHLARNLIADATVSPEEAVVTWGVVPAPYELVKRPASGLMIWHRPFNAWLPGTFQSERDVREAFAHLLLGDLHSGAGDFAYCGQNMTLCEALDTALLPPQPSIQQVGDSESSDYTALGGVAYEPGFEPVSKELFDDAREREAMWKNDSARAARYAKDHASDIWARAATLHFEALDDPSDEVPGYGQEDFAELRPFYPELSMLSDGSLYAWFDAYQSDCCYLNSWTASRDDDFLFYLLGKMSERQHEQDMAKEVGLWSAYALLRGDSLDAALAFGRAAAIYDASIASLARRIADAMRFLVEDKRATDLHGGTVTTMMDMFRLGRSFNAKPIEVEQKLADLNNVNRE